jgi:hypothetical protein
MQLNGLHAVARVDLVAFTMNGLHYALPSGRVKVAKGVGMTVAILLRRANPNWIAPLN